MKKQKIAYILLVTITVVALVGLFVSDPIAQNQDYHKFCDSKTVFNIPNFWNVISNLPFLFVGIIGIIKLRKIAEYKMQYLIFFAGVSLVSVGSAYYHWNPNNHSLVWDRLPMTIAFMSLFTIIISEFIDLKKGFKMLFPAVIIGLSSVVYWAVFDDLRFYFLVQFYPIAAIVVILIFFKSSYNLSLGYWLLLISYIIAKIFEYLDCQTQEAISILSGHTIKHLMAAVGITALLISYLYRHLRTKKPG